LLVEHPLVEVVVPTGTSGAGLPAHGPARLTRSGGNSALLRPGHTDLWLGPRRVAECFALLGQSARSGAEGIAHRPLGLALLIGHALLQLFVRLLLKGTLL